MPTLTCLFYLNKYDIISDKGLIRIIKDVYVNSIITVKIQPLLTATTRISPGRAKSFFDLEQPPYHLV
jgi:hypothetical protein